MNKDNAATFYCRDHKDKVIRELSNFLLKLESAVACMKSFTEVDDGIVMVRSDAPWLAFAMTANNMLGTFEKAYMETLMATIEHINNEHSIDETDEDMH